MEASRKNTNDVEVCRRWGIAPHQLRVIRERAKDGAFDAFKKGPGRPKRDPDVAALEQELQRTNKALRELAIENTLLREKQTAFDRAEGYKKSTTSPSSRCSSNPTSSDQRCRPP